MDTERLIVYERHDERDGGFYQFIIDNRFHLLFSSASSSMCEETMIQKQVVGDEFGSHAFKIHRRTTALAWGRWLFSAAQQQMMYKGRRVVMLLRLQLATKALGR